MMSGNKMNISKTDLEKLVCCHCKEYLSRAPVYLDHKGLASCSQCVVPERPVIRNIQYEIAAQALLFPCHYEDFGCKELIPFEDNKEGNSHEEICPNRHYVCPIDGSSRCDWFGTKKEIMKHCQSAHAEKLLKNPTNLTHNIKKSSMDTFLLYTFEGLFLLYTKICVTSAKIFHSVRFLGAPNEEKNFYFTLSIKRGDEMILKRMDVAPQGCLAMQEPTSLALDINSLLSMLGGYDGVEYTLTILQKKNEVTKATNVKIEAASSSSASNTTEDVVQCGKCKVGVKVLQYRNKKGWLCEICAPKKIICNNVISSDRCKIAYTGKKIDKHRQYFCNFCFLCRMAVLPGMLSTHCFSYHKYNTCKAGDTWKLGNLRGEVTCFMSSIAGLVVCKFQITELSFFLFIYSTLDCAQLSDFSCTVKLINGMNFYSHTFTPRLIYTESWDWSIQTDMNNNKFPFFGQTLHICIDIKKKIE